MAFGKGKEETKKDVKIEELKVETTPVDNGMFDHLDEVVRKPIEELILNAVINMNRTPVSQFQQKLGIVVDRLKPLATDPSPDRKDILRVSVMEKSSSRFGRRGNVTRNFFQINTKFKIAYMQSDNPNGAWFINCVKGKEQIEYLPQGITMRQFVEAECDLDKVETISDSDTLSAFMS